MSGKPKAVVLLSGGMDSCVTTAMAHQSHNLAVLHASYGQRTERRERQAFDEIADFYAVRERLVVRLDHFTQIGGSALTDARIAVPEGPAGIPAGSNEIPPTYVPFRNAHFLAVAVSWAEVIGASAIFIGAVAEDSSGYPDCRPNITGCSSSWCARERARKRESRSSRRHRHAQAEIIQRGLDLGAPLDRTWSCYQFEDEACGSCDSCRLRLSAFAEAGVTDPIAYRTRVRDNEGKPPGGKPGGSVLSGGG